MYMIDYQKQYYKENKKKIKAKNKKWYQENREEILKKERERYHKSQVKDIYNLNQ